MPRPEITIHHATVDRICAYCDFYTFQAREPEDTEQGWAFCKKHQKWFTCQNAEGHLPAGMRTCGEWL